MSAVYAKTIDVFGLSRDSQGEHALLHALLQYADANHSGNDVLTNPVSEVIRRFEAAGLSPHAVTRIKHLLSDVETRFNAGSIR